MKKHFLFLFVFVVVGCQHTTKKVDQTEIRFTGEVVGIDLMPSLAEINLKLTVAMIQSGFYVTKENDVVKLSQISPLDFSIQQANQIQISQIGKWYFASLPLTTTVTLPTAISRTIFIEKFLAKDNLKSSPIIMAISLGLKENLKNIPSYKAKGYLQHITYAKVHSDIKLRLKVVLIDDKKP